MAATKWKNEPCAAFAVSVLFVLCLFACCVCDFVLCRALSLCGTNYHHARWLRMGHGTDAALSHGRVLWAHAWALRWGGPVS